MYPLIANILASSILSSPLLAFGLLLYWKAEKLNDLHCRQNRWLFGRFAKYIRYADSNYMLSPEMVLCTRLGGIALFGIGILTFALSFAEHF